MSEKTIIDMSENFPRLGEGIMSNRFPDKWFVMDEDKSMIVDLYNELIMAVCSKYPNETRHQTALRYIREREELKSIADECRAYEASIRNHP
jgi:hypothetical protein